MTNAVKKPRSDAGRNQLPLPGFGDKEVACWDGGYSVGEAYWPWWLRSFRPSEAGASELPKPQEFVQISLPVEGHDDGI